jgi:chemotaxis protein CheX
MRELIGRDTIVEMVHDVTGEVLSTMLNLDAAQDAVYGEMQHGKSDGVVSFVGLAGPQCVGTGSLQCSSDVACRLAGRFLMSEYAFVDDEVLDAFGELTNMVIGNFKTALEGHLGAIGLSIPTVVHGKNFSTRSPGNEEWTVVPFSWGDDRLYVRVCLKAKDSAEAPPLHVRKPFTTEQIRHTFSELA